MSIDKTIEGIRGRVGLSVEEEQFLRASGAVDEDSVYALLLNLPSLSTLLAVQLPRLAFAVASVLPPGRGQTLATSAAAGLPSFPFGAALPPGIASPGAPTSAALALASLAAAGLPPDAIDLRSQTNPWPVRDQEQRGSCVSFACAALVEHAEAAAGPFPDLSEQFLFCRARGYSGLAPTVDGIWIANAHTAIGQDGVCDEALAPYQGTPIPNDPAQCGSIGTSAAQAALARRRTLSLYATPRGGAAAIVSKHLQTGHCVAVSLPVFCDPSNPSANNWNVYTDYGLIINPLPGMTQIDGHAVCVTGYVPDPSAPGGGWFVIRNSWSTVFGQRLPAPNYVGPEAGYGQISAQYLDQYAWEVCGV